MNASSRKWPLSIISISTLKATLCEISLFGDPPSKIHPGQLARLRLLVQAVELSARTNSFSYALFVTCLAFAIAQAAPSPP